MEQYEGFDFIETLQYHSNLNIVEIATKLNETYFSHPEDIDEVPNHKLQSRNQFSFPTQLPQQQFNFQLDQNKH